MCFLFILHPHASVTIGVCLYTHEASNRLIMFILVSGAALLNLSCVVDVPQSAQEERNISSHSYFEELSLLFDMHIAHRKR
jgi:hypothetical protein